MAYRGTAGGVHVARACSVCAYLDCCIGVQRGPGSLQRSADLSPYGKKYLHLEYISTDNVVDHPNAPIVNTIIYICMGRTTKGRLNVDSATVKQRIRLLPLVGGGVDGPVFSQQSTKYQVACSTLRTQRANNPSVCQM